MNCPPCNQNCNQGRTCPQQKHQEEATMAHVITTKNSHARTPRMERDAQFIWSPGSAEPSGMGWKPTRTDLWGIAMVAVAVVGAVGVIVRSILLSQGGA